MRKVTYRSTLQDWLEAHKTGLSYMSPLHRAELGGAFLLMTAGLAAVVWGKGYPTAWPPGLPPRALLLSIGLLSLFIFAPYPVLSLVGWYLTRLRTVTLQDRHLVTRTRFRWNVVRWLKVTDILDTGHHFCFCHNVPAAVAIPKSAFADPAQARAFLEQAEHYWRQETGQQDPVPPNAAGVWPPAPTLE